MWYYYVAVYVLSAKVSTLQVYDFTNPPVWMLSSKQRTCCIFVTSKLFHLFSSVCYVAVKRFRSIGAGSVIIKTFPNVWSSRLQWKNIIQIFIEKLYPIDIFKKYSTTPICCLRRNHTFETFRYTSDQWLMKMDEKCLLLSVYYIF